MALFVDDTIKSLNYKEDSRMSVSDALTITPAFVCPVYFGGHQDNCHRILHYTLSPFYNNGPS